MINRQEVVDFYERRSCELGWKLPRSQIDSLPSALVHKILLGEGPHTTDTGGSYTRHVVGFDDATVETWGTLALSVRGFAEGIQNSLPLEGHKPIGAPGVLRWIRLALDELATIDQESVSFIQEWCSVIVWIERRKERPDVVELTSTSIPILPFATFVSKKFIRHLPPKHILPVVNFYGIQENLFHEALHNQLASYLIIHNAFLRSPSDSPMIHIPWRKAEWPMDRVLHAAWVYSNLLEFRRRRLRIFFDSEKFLTTLAQLSNDAELSLRYLTKELNRNRSVFSQKGTTVLDRIITVV